VAEIPILHRDEHVIVVEKPPGMLSIDAPSDEGLTLPLALERQGLRVIAVHRLDREVSGAVLFALDAGTRDRLEELFRERAVTKIYWALAQGHVRPAQGTWHFPILEEGPGARISALGKPSQTRYRTLAGLRETTELEIDLVTGRRNQIRLHAAHAGHPLIGERKYARGKDSPLAFRSRRVALHAWRIGFPHPHTGVRIEVESPLPDDLLELRRRAQGPRDPRQR
jgi:RluA family pseudouridine synthase